MKLQKLYMLQVPHKKSLFDAIVWWLQNKNNKCRRFCPTCEFFWKCQEDVELTKQMEV